MDDSQPPSTVRQREMQEALTSAGAYIQTLPGQERKIASMAAGGSPVWEIAQELGISEPAVWRTLDGVVAVATGREVTPVETGGVGADTDPGVTGGYGNTGFGALDTEPIPDNQEPSDV